MSTVVDVDIAMARRKMRAELSLCDVPTSPADCASFAEPAEEPRRRGDRDVRRAALSTGVIRPRYATPMRLEKALLYCGRKASDQSLRRAHVPSRSSRQQGLLMPA